MKHFCWFSVQAKLVDLSLLSVAEVEWLNNYHTQVWEKVSIHLLNCYSNVHQHPCLVNLEKGLTLSRTLASEESLMQSNA